MFASSLVRISTVSRTVFIALSLSILAVSAEPSVDISLSPIQPKFGQRMRVTCIVSGMTSEDYFRLKVKFNCPVVSKDRACFQDCKSTCTPESGCTAGQRNLLSDISCRSFRGTDRLQFDFTFPFKDDAYAGNYMCQFFGRQSARVYIAMPIRPSTTLPPTTTTSTTKRPTTTTTTRAPTTKEHIPVVVPQKPVTNSPPYVPCADAPTALPEVDVHRERIMVVIMVLLICSFAINVIIIVRCVVKRHYIKYPHKKRMSAFLCLNLDRPGSAHTMHHNLGLPYAASVALSAMDDAGGSDSTYSMPAGSTFVPMSGHGRANTLPVIANNDSQVVFIPVLANSMGAFQSASHPRLNSPLCADNVSIGSQVGGGGGRRHHEHPPAVPPMRDSLHRLSNSSIPMRPKLPPHHHNDVVREELIDPDQETLID